MRADRENDQRHRHRLGRLVDVVLDFVAHARLAEERQVDQPEHVERRHQRREKRDVPQVAIRAALARPRLPQDRVLGEEAGEAGDAGDGQGRDQHGAEGDLDLLCQRAHVLHLLLAAHGVDHRAGSEEEQRLEEGVREDVEDAGGKRADAERQEHVAQLRNRGVRQHALDVVLHQADRRGEDRGQRADDGDGLHRIGRQHEQRVGARDHVDAGGDHRRRVDQSGDRRGTFHRVGQPDIQRELRRLAAGADEQQQAGGGDHRIADRKAPAARQVIDRGVLHRAEVPGDGQHAQQKSGVAHAVDDECLVRGGRCRVSLEVESRSAGTSTGPRPPSRRTSARNCWPGSASAWRT